MYLCLGRDFGLPQHSQIGPPCEWKDLTEEPRGGCFHLNDTILSFGPDRGLVCTLVRVSTMPLSRSET